METVFCTTLHFFVVVVKSRSPKNKVSKRKHFPNVDNSVNNMCITLQVTLSFFRVSLGAFLRAMLLSGAPLPPLGFPFF